MIFESPSNSFEWMIFLAQKYSSMFAKGTWLTLYIAVAGTLLGFVLGYIVGIVNDIKLNEGDTVIKKFLIRIMKVIFTVYVEVFRDTPMIVQAMIVYFGIRQMGFENLTPVFAGIVVTVLNVIAVQELFMAAKTVGGNYYKYFESYLVIAVIYFVLCFVFDKLFKLIEKKMQGKTDYALAIEYMDNQ